MRRQSIAGTVTRLRAARARKRGSITDKSMKYF
jgi:hypothetical protein